MAYDVGEATLRIVPSFKGVVEEIDAESLRWRAAAERNLKDITIGVNLDTAVADAHLAEFRALAGRNVDMKVDVERSGLDLAEQSVSGLATAIIALGPALVPIGAAFVGTFAGAASVVGALGAGMGVVALGAKGVAAAVSGELQPAIEQLQQTATHGLLPGVEQAVSSLLTLLPEVDRFVGSLARDIGGLAAEAGNALTGAYWQQFFAFIQSEAGPIIGQFGHIIGNLAHGFAGLVEAFAPVTHQIGDGLVRLTSQFAAFGANAGSSSGFQSFISYIEREGPLVVHTLGDLGRAVGHLLAALAPIGHVVLIAVDAFSRFVSAVPTPALTALAAAFIAATLAAKVFLPVLAALDVELDANPVVLITAAVAALAVGLYELYQNADEMPGVLGDFAVGLRTTVDWVRSLAHWVDSLSEKLGGLHPLLRVLSLGIPGNPLGSLFGGGGHGAGESVTGGFSQQAIQAVANSIHDADFAARHAASGLGLFSVATSAAAANSKDAAKAADDYSNALHALADPLFAENQALQDLKDKQTAYNKAIREHGRDSKQARQALQDMASASLDVAAASAELTAKVKTGDVSIAKARGTLRSWVAAGLITKSAAHDLIGVWGGLINKADGTTKAIARSANDQAWSKFAGAAKHAVNGVLQSLGLGASQAGPLGTQLAQGYAAGMASDGALGAVVGSAVALVTAAINAIKSKEGQDSHSPARRFMPEGFNAATGYAMGMDLGTPMIEAAARRMVAAAIRHAVAPDITDPARLVRMLGSASGAAVAARQSALAAHDIYRDLREQAKGYDEAARAADKAAEKAKRHADAMKAGTDAEKAAKKAAEDHAAALQKLANVADHTARQADRAADHAKNTWQKLQDAAGKATQKAVDDAQQLVSVVSDQLDDLQRQISDFSSQVSSGLTGDDSLTSIWSGLVDAQTSAASNLTAAQSAYAAAQQAVIDAGAAATADQMQALTDAQNALTAAQAAADQANAAVSVTGVQDSLGQVLATAQDFATDLQTLIGEGASQALIEQLVAMGPAAGDALASQLVAAGPESVTKLSSTLDQIASYAQSAADAMAGSFFGGGVSAMEQFIEGLISQFPSLRSALQPLLDSIDGLFADAALTGQGVPIATLGGDGAAAPVAVAAARISRTVPIVTPGSLNPGTGQGTASFEGNLYLDSGEFLGRVRGETNQVLDARLAGANLASRNGTPGGALGALSSPHAVAASR